MEAIQSGIDYLFENYNHTLVVTFGTFIIHEIAYFAFYIPYLIADFMPSLHKYKIQKVTRQIY